MNFLGINWTYILSMAAFIGWPVLAIVALLQLRKRDMTEMTRVLWVAVILLLPLAGAAAYWIIEPGSPVLPEDDHSGG